MIPAATAGKLVDDEVEADADEETDGEIKATEDTFAAIVLVGATDVLKVVLRLEVLVRIHGQIFRLGIHNSYSQAG
jgi:hypothetical protein